MTGSQSARHADGGKAFRVACCQVWPAAGRADAEVAQQFSGGHTVAAANAQHAAGELAASGKLVRLGAAEAQSGRVPGCFGGRELFFIEPDGSVWDCPSSLKIAATSPGQRRNIRGRTAAGLFATGPRCTDCSLFSHDCVNMWPP